MRRQLSIPAILLLSLSLGLWIGALWHSTSNSGNCCNNTCLDGTRILDSFRKAKHSRPVLTQAKVSAPTCAFCLAGALVQDAPSQIHSNLTPFNTIDRLVVAAADDAPLETRRAHPPERGPPA